MVVHMRQILIVFTCSMDSRVALDSLSFANWITTAGILLSSYTYKGHRPLKICLWAPGGRPPVGNHWSSTSWQSSWWVLYKKHIIKQPERTVKFLLQVYKVFLSNTHTYTLPYLILRKISCCHIMNFTILTFVHLPQSGICISFTKQTFACFLHTIGKIGFMELFLRKAWHIKVTWGSIKPINTRTIRHVFGRNNTILLHPKSKSFLKHKFERTVIFKFELEILLNIYN